MSPVMARTFPANVRRPEWLEPPLMPARWYTQPGHMRLQAVRGLVVALLARLQYPPLCAFLLRRGCGGVGRTRRPIARLDTISPKIRNGYAEGEDGHQVRRRGTASTRRITTDATCWRSLPRHKRTRCTRCTALGQCIAHSAFHSVCKSDLSWRPIVIEGRK